MKRKLLLAAAAALTLVACNKEQAAPELVPGREVTVTAAAEPVSKVFYQNDTQFTWGKIDQVGIYVYPTSGSGSSWVAPFDLTSGAGSASGKFSRTLESGTDFGYVATYPYTEGTYFNESTGVLTFNLPAFYYNLSEGTDSFGAVRMPMAAKLDMAGDKGTFALRNVGGVVKVTLTDVPAGAKYFKLSATDGNLSGDFIININDIGTGVLSGTGDEGSAVELQLADALTERDVIDVYFPVPCGTYTFRIGVYGDGSTLLDKVASRTNTVSRGTILCMPAISLKPDVPSGNKSEWSLIGWHLADTGADWGWSTNVDMYEVEGNTDWTVAKNIQAREGNIEFKFRQGDAWVPQIGAQNAQHKQLNTKFPVKLKTQDSEADPANIHLDGTGSYDIYFNYSTMTAFILTAGSAFAVPSAEEVIETGDCAYTLIGYHDSDEWATDVPLHSVAGQDGWYVAKNIGAGPNGNISFKFRKDGGWAEQYGAANGWVKQLNTKISIIATGGGDITLIGTDSYDVYFNEDEGFCFILAAGSAFAIPSAWEEAPVLADDESEWSLIGQVEGYEWNKDFTLKKSASSRWHYYKNIQIDGAFKIRGTGAWTRNFGTGDTVESGNTYKMISDGGDCIIASAGKYDVYFDSTVPEMYIVTAGGAAPAE